MTTVTVASSLVLDDDMFEQSREQLALYAPDEVEDFTWERFVARESWLLIPDVENPDLPWYKAEFVIKNRPPYEQTVKLNVWMSADLRRNGAPQPHSHPWESFTGHVFMGGYVEDRYRPVRASLIANDPHSAHDVGLRDLARDVVHRAGSHNDIDQTIFHEVTEVLEPGRTLSLMNCGLGRPGGWGYLDPETGLYIPSSESETDPRFRELFLDRNPHRR